MVQFSIIFMFIKNAGWPSKPAQLWYLLFINFPNTACKFAAINAMPSRLAGVDSEGEEPTVVVYGLFDWEWLYGQEGFATVETDLVFLVP